jgi:hypothetical protein
VAPHLLHTFHRPDDLPLQVQQQAGVLSQLAVRQLADLVPIPRDGSQFDSLLANY